MWTPASPSPSAAIQGTLVDYLREDNNRSSIYLDPNYNDTFALLHPEHRQCCEAWDGIGNERRLIHLLVFCPLDLAVSKLSRFSPNDQADILALAQHRYFSTPELQKRATELSITMSATPAGFI